MTDSVSSQIVESVICGEKVSERVNLQFVMNIICFSKDIPALLTYENNTIQLKNLHWSAVD